MDISKTTPLIALISSLLLFGSNLTFADSDTSACVDMVKGGFRPIDEDRTTRFLGKVTEQTARCRGGQRAVRYRYTPWGDWGNYWATGDEFSLKEGDEAKTILGEHLKPNGRGIDGALLDLEYQRIELIKFNLFDNYTYQDYVTGDGDRAGPAIQRWPQMRLDAGHMYFNQVGGEGVQRCKGELIRYRTLTGICNDIFNPRMGSTGTFFSRNVDFASTFPHLGLTPLAEARHSDADNGMRISLLKPDPQLISRQLFSRPQTSGSGCNNGQGRGLNSLEDNCDYTKASFFNVLAAFWIQFMTHDWFSHLDEGRNERRLFPVGCDTADAQARGCRPGDRMEPALFAQQDAPGTFSHEGKTYLKRAHKTTRNHVTAWWDASQIYGHDELSLRRVVRDENDKAKLKLNNGYLPVFEACDLQQDPACYVQPQWLGQESTAFPDNWNIGLSFYHNLFVREHNSFVDAFREMAQRIPNQDSGLRNPAQPKVVITYSEVSDEELYQAARLVVSAMIAKIHTIEWTTQLLYNEPLYRGMNSNWFGLFDMEEPSRVSSIVRRITHNDRGFFSRISEWFSGELSQSHDPKKSNSWYSVFASGAGIFGLGNSREEGIWWWKHDGWDVNNPQHVNGGVNHFGSPFNFPEEFTSVYRLHPLVPDLIEFRDVQSPNELAAKLPVIDSARAGATSAMRDRGIENWALSMGRQRLGALHLKNHPSFLQNFPMDHLNSPTGKLDIVALDIIRDRERGVPRFNEFRRQIGLKTLTSFDDFVDKRLAKTSPTRLAQEDIVREIRDIYGTHVCDASKVITDAQLDDEGQPINDCFGQPDGSVVDNIEDVDLSVGWLAEYTRPHGFAISETQFHIFIINASRRLFSDRFFTSSYRPEFYTRLGIDWVNNNGLIEECPYEPETLSNGAKACNEPALSNGHKVAVSPFKRVLMRNIPQLREELMPVVNAFDPWARDRGNYYSLAWRARKGAESDPAFNQ